jgi:uncharacterized RDD family membrane protein YckC
MNWYYVNQGKQAGPVDDAQLAELRRTGVVQADTLIWREGMANWEPYSTAFVEPQPVGEGVATSSQTPAFPATTVAEAPQAVCSECGRMFAKDSMIRYGTVHVCANCKPVFMQKLAEGARINTGALNYAGFWIRFAAYFLDQILLSVVSLGMGFVAGLIMGVAFGNEPTAIIILQIVLFVIQMGIAISYEVILTTKYGATLGKMACKLAVVTPDGGPITYGRSFGRFFSKIVSSLTCLIGYIMAGFDEEKRSLHDRMCNTRVVYK